MKFLLEFANYKPSSDFELSDYDDHFEDPEAIGFLLKIKKDGVIRTFELEYDAFLEFIQKNDPNLRSYIKSAKLEDFESIFGDLQELGFSIKDSLQKYVDENISESQFAKLPYDEDQVTDGEMRSIFGLEEDENGDLLDPTEDDEEDLDYDDYTDDEDDID